MPDIKQKLIELICSTEYGNSSLIGNNFQKGFIEKIADHIIASGYIEELQNEAYDLGVDSALHNHFGLSWEDAAGLRKEITRLQEATKWIPVSERLPEPETEVMILAVHKTYSFKGAVTTRHIMTTGMYEDGSINTEDSVWHWETDGFEYDEELDVHIIPKGWWEYKHYNGDDEYNHPIDDTVTHWMPLPQPQKEDAQ